MGLGKRGIAIAAAIASMWASTSVALAEGTKPSYSANGAFTTDYVFRGFSQSAQDPALQGGADFGYGMFYAGAWASMIDFGPSVAEAEVDLYAGIKHSFGGFDFDLGAIYYIYPGASDATAELDYVELKFGVATTIQKFGVGATVFYSPEYTGKSGETVTLEGKASYELPSFQGITPSLTGLVGTTISTEDNANFQAAFGNGDDSYVYWNAGMSFAIDKLTLDFRYWDTNLSKGYCNGPTFQCDERFVFTAGISF